MSFRLSMTLAAVAAVGVGLALTFDAPPVDSVQRGYRGLGMVELANPRETPVVLAANRVPEPIAEQAPSGQPSGQVYTNVQVLKDLDSDEFMRLMAAITEWVSPEQGCAYCHADGEELASDSLYTKVVARRMLEMTLDINARWQPHVAGTGVTCFTCHRGQPVPAGIWFADPGPPQARGAAGNRAGQNAPAPAVGLTSLPFDPFGPFLADGKDVRVVSASALPEGNRTSIKQTEWTYGLMMHMSEALGVNCTFCHNTRSFAAWDQSTPQRSVAWHGIRMVRQLNADYLEPLKPQFPANRLGRLGDAPKVGCGTCHQGAYKPLLGAGMLADYPYLAPAR